MLDFFNIQSHLLGCLHSVSSAPNELLRASKVCGVDCGTCLLLVLYRLIAERLRHTFVPTHTADEAEFMVVPACRQFVNIIAKDLSVPAVSGQLVLAHRHSDKH